MHADQLPPDDVSRDLPFFKTSETARPNMEHWDRNQSDGIPTGLPSLTDLDARQSESTRPWQPSPADATSAADREDPVRGFQFFLAGSVIGGVFGSVMTYWISVGF
jgi:hypothetical protein